MRQGFGGNADAVIPYAQNCLRSFGMNRKRDRAARQRIFDGVVEQVDDDLLQPRGVARNQNRLRRVDGHRKRFSSASNCICSTVE